jgi:DNA-binding beta-propeller fold protein YncE
VAALPDGSRAYVGSYYEDANHNICPQVTAINAKNYAVESTIAVPGFPAYEPFCAQTRFRMMMAAAGDSTRAYMSSCDGGNVSFMDTSTDTYFQNLTAPASGRLNNPPQNPVFLLAGP